MGASQHSFLSELFEAVKQPTFFLVIGVLLIQFAFVLSYVGAFHHPTPHRVPIAVVAPAQVSGRLVSELNGIRAQPLHATAVADQSSGLTLLRHGSTSAVLIVNPVGKTDALLVASGGGAATAIAVEDVIARAEAAQHRSATVTDAVPAQPGDARSLSGFYLVVGLLIGGYLVAALLSIATRARPATIRRALIRLIVLVPYALLSGLGGAIIVGPILGALTGHLLAIAALGALLVYCAAVVTMAFQALLGTLGIALTLILFVVLGNPSAGGAYPAPLLPGFWRVIGPALPNGAGVEALRRIVYFSSYGIAGNLILIAAYILAAIAVALVGTSVLNRRAATGEPGTDSAEVHLAKDAGASAMAPMAEAMAGTSTTALSDHPPLALGSGGRMASIRRSM
ncbi:MAG: DUF3533 domain-containing protein [Solirubrobacteraceae bacterium]